MTVTQSATGSVTLSWAPPELNTDGTYVDDLAGYNIYYGTTSGSYDYVVSIDDPGITTYVIDNLSPATYYFVATALNSAGAESAFSEEVARQI